MTVQPKENSYAQATNQAIADIKRAVDEAVAPRLQDLIDRLEQGTELVGNFVTPIAENPLVKFATKAPGISWLMAALGQVDAEKVQQDVAELHRKFPLETAEQLAQRVIAETAFKAAGIGLVTNVIPPLAIALLAIDIAAVTALQAEMIYRIAAIYGFSVKEPTRRGEVLAIWGLSTGGSGVLKAGLSIVEVIPFLGTAVGISSNAALLYSLGYIACRFYEAKLAAIARTAAPVTPVVVP